MKNELFEIELIIYIKMDLALNNLKRLICHKTQPKKKTKQKTKTSCTDARQSAEQSANCPLL